jgi:hypothetical protein
MLGAFWVGWQFFCREERVPKVFPKRFHLKNPLALWSLLGKKIICLVVWNIRIIFPSIGNVIIPTDDSSIIF